MGLAGHVIARFTFRKVISSPRPLPLSGLEVSWVRSSQPVDLCRAQMRLEMFCQSILTLMEGVKRGTEILGRALLQDIQKLGTKYPAPLLELSGPRLLGAFKSYVFLV